MNKLLVTFCLVAISVLTSFSQNEFVYKIGASFSDLIYNYSDATDSPENKIYVGPLAGFDISWRLADKWRFMNGITYSRRGRADYTTTGGRLIPRDVSIHYASVPVQLDYTIVSGLSVKLGIELNYILKSNHNFFPDFNRIDYGPTLGFSWRQKNLIFNFAGYYGMLPFHEFQPPDDLKLSMKYAQLSVGYVIK